MKYYEKKEIENALTRLTKYIHMLIKKYRFLIGFLTDLGNISAPREIYTAFPRSIAPTQ